MIGKTLGAYEVVAKLGQGGMGEVYRAHDTKLGRDVALKILPLTFADDPDRLARFRREAHVLASLNHPNIAHIHGIEDSGGIHALVMELVTGEDLSARIAHGPVPLDDALPIARQIAEALETAHEHGVIHRDLKPANIKVRDDGTVKVLDFGLAKALEPAGLPPADAANSPTLTARGTQMGVILGTAAYMAPEQARGKTVDRRADVWAFGVVLYEMLTGRRAFEGADVTDTLAAVLKDTPSMDALPPNVPASIRRLLRRCLEKDRARRLDSMGAAKLEITDAMDPAQRFAEAAATSGAAMSLPAIDRASRIGWIVAAVAFVLLAALSILTLNLSRRSPPNPQVVRFEIQTPPTLDPGSFAVSPDGRRLVYVANGDKRSQLWLRPLDETSARPLAGTEGATFPFWSADSRSLGFFADGKLKRVDLTGGGAIELTTAPSARGGAWNADNVILFVPGTQSGIFRISASGGQTTVVIHPSTELGASLRWPQFLPDGRKFIFLSMQGPPESRGIYMGDLDGHVSKRIIAADSAAAFVPPNWLLFTRQRALVVSRLNVDRGETDQDAETIAQEIGDAGIGRGSFTVSATGTLAHRTGGPQRRQLTWIDRTNRVVGTFGPPDDAWLASPELSPDEKRVAVFREIQGTNTIWMIDGEHGDFRRFTFGSGPSAYPVWFPDGSRLFFMAIRTGGLDLFEKASNGAADERVVLRSAQSKWPLAVSPDGQYLLYRVLDRNTGLDLWATPLTGGSPAFPLTQTSAEETEGQFSPNGKWIAYVSNESDGRYDVFLRPLKGSGKWQLSNGGGTQIRWRADGRELFYVAPDGRLMAMPLSFTADGQFAGAGTPSALFSTRLASGSNVSGIRAQYAVAKDGRFLMNVAIDNPTTPPISVVLNWPAGLRKN